MISSRSRSVNRRLHVESLEQKTLMTGAPDVPTFPNLQVQSLSQALCVEFDYATDQTHARNDDEFEAAHRGAVHASYMEPPMLRFEDSIGSTPEESDLIWDPIPAVLYLDPAQQTSGAGMHSLAAIPSFHSKADAPVSIFLDFDGHHQSIWSSYSSVVTPVYDVDGDPLTFSDTELANIVEIWGRVAEDFAPFDVDVTTSEPNVLAAGVEDSQAIGKALRVAIGGSWTDWYNKSASGVAYVNSFTSQIANVVFVFAEALFGNASWVADTASHEAGHAFGLQHQSRIDSAGNLLEEYHPGDGFWGPIMGRVGPTVTTWHNGLNNYGTSQDDMAIIAGSGNGFGYRADDHRGVYSDASALVDDGVHWTSAGVIETNDDVDVFRFTPDESRGYDIAVNVAAIGANLDVVLELQDSAGNVIRSANPSDSLSATLLAGLSASTDYYVVVSSTDTYGRVGQYTVNVTPNDDTMAPTGSVVINNGDAFTNSRAVTLALTAIDDVTGVAEMRFSINRTNDASFSAWEPFAVQKTLMLPDYQGTNYVNVHLRDQAGNIRRWIWDSIVLDTAAPAGTVVINGGAEFTNSREITLDISGTDSLSSVAEMRFSINRTDDASFGAWEPFAVQKTLTLPDYQGANYVNVHLRDQAGNIRRGVWDSIALDTAAPTGTVVINGGAEFTNSREITLDISGTDSLSGVAEMRFSINRTDDASFSTWEPFAAQKTLTLPDYQGTNYMNVHLRDRAGNIRWIWDSIVLDTALMDADFADNNTGGTV